MPKIFSLDKILFNSYVAQYGDAKKLKAIPLAIAGWCRYLLGVDDKGEIRSPDLYPPAFPLQGRFHGQACPVPHLSFRLQSGSQKVGIRYGETIKAYVAQYGDAKKLKAIPLAIAGWCR